MRLDEKIKYYSGLVGGWLTDFQPPAHSATLLEACLYAVRGEGKRFRPVLALLSGECLGLAPEGLRSFSIALELLHSASLIHDDLPALDNDDLRRGVPTVHKQFGEASAILAGDALISEAFSFVVCDAAVSAEVKVELVRELSATNLSICAGQVLDLESATLDHSAPAALEARHLLKTGALIASAAACPALFVGPRSSDEFQALTSYGRELGLLFQITDDLLDARANVEENSDVRLGLQTFVTAYGEEGACLKARETAARAVSALGKLARPTDDLAGMVELVLKRRK